MVRQTVSCRRYPIWGWPGLLVFRQGGQSPLRQGDSSPTAPKKWRAEDRKNLIQFGHLRKTLRRASLRSDNCPTIPDQCPTISDWVSDFIGIRSPKCSLRSSATICLCDWERRPSVGEKELVTIQAHLTKGGTLNAASRMRSLTAGNGKNAGLWNANTTKKEFLPQKLLEHSHGLPPKDQTCFC